MKDSLTLYSYFLYYFLGKMTGQECNLPKDLIDQGHYQNWTAKECMNNLKQLSSFS